MEIKSTYDNCKTLINAGRLTDANILSLFFDGGPAHKRPVCGTYWYAETSNYHN